MKEGFNGQQLLRMPEDIYGKLEQEEVLKELCIYAIGYFPFASHHYIDRPDGMEGARGQFTLLFCVEGEGWFRLEDKYYAVSANQFFILPMDRKHSYGSLKDGRWTIYWVQFGGSLARYYSAGFEQPTTIKVGTSSRIRFRQNLFEEMYEILAKGYTLESLCYASSLLFTYLSSFKFMATYRLAISRKLEVANEKALVRDIIHFMEEKVEKRITLKELSEYTGFSITHMSRVFRKHTGYAPMNYFNILKIRYSCWLLDHTFLKIHQISYKLGYEDTRYFSRLFKKIINLSPSEYRNENGANTSNLFPIFP